MFEKSQARIAGAVGGKSKSAAKRRASRRNGKDGGRKPSRTLIERLLGRKIRDHERDSIAEAYKELLLGEQSALKEHFQVLHLAEPLHTDLWRAKNRRLPERIRYIIKKLKLACKYHTKPAKQLKPYLLESVRISSERESSWEARHPGIPCPPQRRKIYFELIPGYSGFKSDFQRGNPLTVEDIMERGGAQWTESRAKAALAYLSTKPAGDALAISRATRVSAPNPHEDTFEEEIPF